jgi:tetratricopeptide (TPR) repeat protein
VAVIAFLVMAGAGILVGLRMREARRGVLVRLVIHSDPSPAEVRLDGRFVGVTPLELEDLAPGEHVVALQCRGHRPFAERRRLAGAEEVIDVRLVPTPAGGLTVRSRPDGAEVILDGQSRGNTPMGIDRLAPGSYQLVLRKAGHELWSQTVTVAPGPATEVTGELENSTLKFLRGAVETNPEDLHYWTELAHYLGCHDMDKESVEAFKKGLALCMSGKGQGDEVSRHLQMLSRQMHWPGKDRAEFRREIGDAFVQLAKDNADNPQAVGRLAGMLENAGRQAEALELYLAACRRNAGADAHLLLRAFALAVALKRMPQAEEVAGLARTGRAKDGTLRYQMAETCLQMYGRHSGKTAAGLLALGEKLYGEAAELGGDGPSRARAWYGMARAQNLGGQTEKAAGSYGKAAEAILNGGKGDRRRWAEWEFERALLLVKLDRTQDARGVLTRIISDAPKCPAQDRARAELERLAKAPPPGGGAPKQ